jgi:hypothetical protein
MKIRDYLQWQDDTDLDAFITRLEDNVYYGVVDTHRKAQADVLSRVEAVMA